MNDSSPTYKASHCTVKNAPVPVSVTCPRCGYDVEIWTDEDETVCCSCGFRIFEKEKTIH